MAKGLLQKKSLMDEWFLQFISLTKANLPFYFRYKLVDFPMKELEMKKINE